MHRVEREKIRVIKKKKLKMKLIAVIFNLAVALPKPIGVKNSAALAAAGLLVSNAPHIEAFPMKPVNALMTTAGKGLGDAKGTIFRKSTSLKDGLGDKYPSHWFPDSNDPISKSLFYDASSTGFHVRINPIYLENRFKMFHYRESLDQAVAARDAWKSAESLHEELLAKLTKLADEAIKVANLMDGAGNLEERLEKLHKIVPEANKLEAQIKAVGLDEKLEAFSAAKNKLMRTAITIEEGNKLMEANYKRLLKAIEETPDEAHDDDLLEWQ